MLDLKPGETLLVHGAAGGVGQIAVQLAVAAGATVVGTAGERNHELLRGRTASGYRRTTAAPAIRARRRHRAGIDHRGTPG